MDNALDPRKLFCHECGWRVDGSAGRCNALVKEMVERLTILSLSGKLSSWFAKWNERATAELATTEDPQ